MTPVYVRACGRACVCACVRVCVRAFSDAFVRVFVRACVRVCVRACTCVVFARARLRAHRRARVRLYARIQAQGRYQLGFACVQMCLRARPSAHVYVHPDAGLQAGTHLHKALTCAGTAFELMDAGKRAGSHADTQAHRHKGTATCMQTCA